MRLPPPIPSPQHRQRRLSPRGQFLQGGIAFGLLILLLILCFTLASNALADSAKESVTVEVRGFGPTYEAAKADAVKNALQLALSQLVIVDRIVSENQVLRDRVISTSNGYVDRYQEQSLSSDEHGFSVDAAITVSATRIQNLLGVVTGGGGKVTGAMLGGEIQRRLAQQAALENQAEARQQIFERIFENYPLSSVNIELKNVSISTKNASVLILDLEQTYKKEFLQGLEETLSALAIHQCRYDHPRNSLFSLLGAVVLCPYKDEIALREVMSSHLPEKELPFAPTYSTVCIGQPAQNQVRCFILDHGARLTNRSVKNEGFQLFGTFVDETGRSALKKKSCLKIGSRAHLGFERSLAARLDTRGVISYLWSGQRVRMWNGFHLTTEPIRFHVEIDASEVDLRRASRFIAVAGMVTQNENLVGLTAERSQAVGACEVVADAVRIQAMTADVNR